MERPCDACGTTYQAQRKNSRFCSPKCRVRASRGGGQVVDLPTDTAAVSVPLRGSVESAVFAELERVERLDTTLGQTCLTLARRLDFPGVDTGSALSSVAGRLDDLMAKALKGTKAATAPQQLGDELAARRQRRA